MASLSSATLFVIFVGEHIEVICFEHSKDVKVCTVKSFLSHSYLSTTRFFSLEAIFFKYLSTDILGINMHISTNSPPTTHTHLFSPQDWQHSIYNKIHLAFFTTIYLRGLSISVRHKCLHPVYYTYIVYFSMHVPDLSHHPSFCACLGCFLFFF